MTLTLKQLSDGDVSQLKILAERQGWEQVVHDCRDEQQVRMPGTRR